MQIGDRVQVRAHKSGGTAAADGRPPSRRGEPEVANRWFAPGMPSVISPEQARQAEARRAWWSQVNRLVSLSRFKLGLSVRKTQILVKFVYARSVSIGHVERLTQRVGRRAEAALAQLSECRRAVARFLLYDETYPKMQKRAYSLGVAICEHGLIRSVRCITRKAKDIPAQLRGVVGTDFQPEYFLTDLDVLFNKYMKAAGLKLTHLRDRVHLIRQIVRLFDEVSQFAPNGQRPLRGIERIEVSSPSGKGHAPADGL